jgi:hypothetical protein
VKVEEKPEPVKEEPKPEPKKAEPEKKEKRIKRFSPVMASQLKTALEASISDADGLAFVQSGNIANIDATPLPVVDTTVATLGSPVPGTTTTTVAGTAGNSAGETIVLTVNFDGNVSGLSSGTNATIFTVGGTGVNAVWGGAAGSSTRTLTYTVAAGQNGQTAIDEAALKAALTTGITDVAGNAFSYTANSGNIANIDATALPVIDTTAPTTTAAATAIVDDVGTVKGNVTPGGVTDDTSVTVTGTLGGATAGAALLTGETLKVFDGATYLGTATVTVATGGQSTWTYNDTRTLTNAQSLSYTARVADAAGNDGAAGNAFLATVDTAAPTTEAQVGALVDNAGTVTGNVTSGGVTDDTSVSLTGTLGAATAGASLASGETLRVFDGATYLGTATVSTVAGGQSTWSYTDTRTLTNAQSLSYTARVADAAGNEGTAGSAFVATVDTTPPTINGTVTAIVDNVGLVKGNVAPGGVTDDTSVSVVGNLGGATAGAALASGEVLKVYDGATLLGTATVTVDRGNITTCTLARPRGTSRAQ